MFAPMELPKENLVIKPMSCPFHAVVYSSKQRSYKDLPIRYAEHALQHRYESSGSLTGLERVRAMELTDSHVFARPDQIKQEFKHAYKLVAEILETFNIKIDYLSLSVRDKNDKEKFFDDDNIGLIGTYERFVATLLEQTMGVLPIWCTPQQIQIIPINLESHSEYSEELRQLFKKHMIRSNIDLRDERLNYKIRDGQVKKIPYQLVIGDNEVKDKSITFRTYGSDEQTTLKVDEFIKLILDKINNKLNKELEKLEKVDTSIIEGEHGYMVDGILGGFKSAVDKMKYVFYKQLLLGMIAAMIIIITYVACLNVTQSIEAPGLKQLVIGWVFPAALVVITLLGGGFLTTHVVAAIPTIKKIVRVDTYFKNVGTIFLGNIIGAFIVVTLVYLAGMMDENSGLGLELHNISLKKLTYLVDTTGHNAEGNHLYSLKDLNASNVAKTILAVFASGILFQLSNDGRSLIYEIYDKTVSIYGKEIEQMAISASESYYDEVLVNYVEEFNKMTSNLATLKDQLQLYKDNQEDLIGFEELQKEYDDQIAEIKNFYLSAKELLENDIQNEFKTAIPTSFMLGGSALLLSYVLGIPLGIIAAKNKEKTVDNTINGFFLGISSIPATVLVTMI
ncbi:hypothetical protein FQR65_LT15346 [Abscondita terminalis]|nr:hypothetical protein FQR65_LT15346 [Abscondita terminalis]